LDRGLVASSMLDSIGRRADRRHESDYPPQAQMSRPGRSWRRRLIVGLSA
jgi:hypothetical protein